MVVVVTNWHNWWGSGTQGVLTILLNYCSLLIKIYIFKINPKQQILTFKILKQQLWAPPRWYHPQILFLRWWGGLEYSHVCKWHTGEGSAAALWRASAERESGGALGTDLNCLWAVCEEVVAGGKSRAASLSTRMSRMMVLEANLWPTKSILTEVPWCSRQLRAMWRAEETASSVDLLAW